MLLIVGLFFLFGDDVLAELVLGAVCAAIHHVGELVRVVFVADFVHFDRVKVEHVDELSQFLDEDDFVLLVGALVGRGDYFAVNDVLAYTRG